MTPKLAFPCFCKSLNALKSGVRCSQWKWGAGEGKSIWGHLKWRGGDFPELGTGQRFLGPWDRMNLKARPMTQGGREV